TGLLWCHGRIPPAANIAWHPIRASSPPGLRRRRPPLVVAVAGNCEHPRRDVEAQLLGGLEIYHQLELGRQHNRQITRLLAFEDASGINASLAICFGNACSVAHP